MSGGTAKLHFTQGGRSQFAEVAVDVDASAADVAVVVDCSGTGFQSQGALEDVPRTGYEEWKLGARVGVLFALRCAAVPAAHVTILRITGATTDTNPSVVAACAARALWNALGLAFPSEAVARLQALVTESHLHPPTHIPDLG